MSVPTSSLGPAVSRRAFLTSLFMGASFVLAGCSSGTGSAGSTASNAGTAAGKDGGELTVGIYIDGAMGQLDAASYNGPHPIYKMIYEGFTEDGGKGKVTPLLATSWDVSDDGKTYTYHLRKNVTFSDGTPFNAAAAAFNLKRWTNNPRYDQLTSDYVDAIETPDDYTVKVTYRNATYVIPLEQSYPRPNRFLSPASVDNDGAASPNPHFTKPVGTGPWMLDSYEKDKSFSLVPNPKYWGKKPHLKRINFKVIADAQARLMALQSGEVDIIGGDLIGKIPIENIKELKAGGQFKIYSKQTLSAHFVSFNQQVPALQDKAVRLALNYATNEEEIAKSLMDDNVVAATGMYAKGAPYVTDKNNHGYAYSVKKAKKTLEDAGWKAGSDGVREKDGQRLEFKFVYTTDEFPEWKSLAEYLQAQYQKVGVKLDLQPVDKNGYLDATQTNRDFDITMRRTSSDSWVPHSSLMELFTNSAGRSWSLVWTDADLAAKIQDVLRTLDEHERQAKYDEIFGYISDNALVVPLYYPVQTFAVNPQKVAGFKIGVNAYAPVAWSDLRAAGK